MQNILKDLQQYSQKLTISQVMTFFERKGLTITRSMIQNHVRDGLIPPPLGKRYYTHKHIAALVLITKLKTVYEMNHIKAVIAPLMDEEGLPLEVYYDCINKTEELPTHKNLNTLVLMAHSVDLKEEALIRV